MREEPPAEVTPPPEPALARVAKLAGLVTAVAVLCGAIVAAAFLDLHRRQAEPQPAENGTTGVQAFTMPGASEDGVTAGLEPVAQQPAVEPSEEPVSHAAGARPEDIAREFYRLVDEDPKRALAKLGGPLTDDDRQALVVAWRDIDRLHVEETRTPRNGWVEAVLTMTTTDGRSYRMEQELRIDPPMVTEVRLLSAQRSA